MITTTAKEQTAFRFEKELLASMKQRAKSQGRSLNSYVSFLVMEDLKRSRTLPRVSLSEELSPEVARFSGILEEPSAGEL